MKPQKDITKKQKAALTQEEFYKARLIFNVQPEPEVTLSVRMTEALRDEMRKFCVEHRIQQQYFINEAVKEVLSRIKKEMADTAEVEEARQAARKQTKESA